MKQLRTIARLRITMLLPVAVLFSGPTCQFSSGQETGEQEVGGQKTIVQGHLFGQNELGETVEAVAGARIELLREDGLVAGSATTDDSGFFSIEDLEPGKLLYKVTADGYEQEDAGRGFELPARGVSVKDLFVGKGTPDPEAEPAPTPAKTEPTPAAGKGPTPARERPGEPGDVPTQTDPPQEQEEQPIPEETSVQGYVFGQNEMGETREMVAGALVELTDASGAAAGSSTTDKSGFYSIGDLYPGRFRVKVTAAAYETEDAKRGFELPLPKIHKVDLFLAKGPEEVTEPGELSVKVWEETSDGKFPLSGASVEALQLEGRQVVPVPTAEVGVHKVALSPGKWSASASVPGFESNGRQTVTVPTGGSGECEFTFKRSPPVPIDPARVLAVVAVERVGGAAGGEPMVSFGKPASEPGVGTAKANGEQSLSKRGPPDPADTLADKVDSVPLRRLNEADLASLGRTPDQMPSGEWDWYLARPAQPLTPGLHQAAARLEAYPSAISVSKSVLPNMTTIFDLVLRKPTPPLEVDEKVEEATTVQGYVFGQNAEGERIETVPGVQLQLREGTTVIGSTSSDETGFYIFRDMYPGSFVYRLRAPGYKDENAGRGFSLPGPGAHIVDLFLAKEPKDDDPPTKPDDKSPPARLEGYVAELAAGVKRPLDAVSDGAVVKLVNVRSGRPTYLRPDQNGYYLEELEPGRWLVNATATGYGSLPTPAPVEIVEGQTERRDFTFSKRAEPGRLIGSFWEETDEGERIRLSDSDALVELINFRTEEPLTVPARESQYQRELEEGSWLATPIPPPGFEIVEPHGAGAVTIVGGRTARRDFVLRRSPLGELVCRVWEVNSDGKFPLTAEVMLLHHGTKSEPIPVSGEYRATMSPGSLVAAVIPPLDFELVEPTAPLTVSIVGHGTTICEFTLRRRKCVAGPTLAVVAVEQRHVEGKGFVIASEPAVFLMKSSSAQRTDDVFTGTGSGGEGIPAASIRRLEVNEYSQWGIATDEEGRWAWFLAEAGQPLPPDEYFAEANLEGYSTARSLSRPVACHLTTVFDLTLTRRLPHVTVIVVSKDDQPLPGTPIQLVSSGKTLREAITMTTNASGQDDRILQDGTGSYKVLLAPKGYQPFGRRVMLLEDENVLKFRLFKTGEQKTEDFAGVVSGEITTALNDVVQSQVTERVEGAKIELQPVGDVAISMQFENAYFSDSQGHFRIQKLPEGTYHVTVSKQGFRTLITQVNVKPGMPLPHPFVLKRRIDTYENAIACMLTRGWGKTPDAQAAAKYYYQQAVTSESTHCAADYAMTLCLLSARRDREAREQVRRAIGKRSDDFVWDRSTEALIWLDMFLGENRAALDEMRRLTEKPYAERIDNPGSADTAYLLGVSFGVFQGPLQEEAAALHVAENEQTVLASLRASQREQFERGRADVGQQFAKFQSELAKIREQCRMAWEKQKEEELARVESRITRTEQEATFNRTELETVSVTEIDAQLEAIQEEMETLVIEVKETNPVYNQMEREFLVVKAQLDECIRRTRKPKSGGGGSYQEFNIDGGGGDEESWGDEWGDDDGGWGDEGGGWGDEGGGWGDEGGDWGDDGGGGGDYGGGGGAFGFLPDRRQDDGGGWGDDGGSGEEGDPVGVLPAGGPIVAMLNTNWLLTVIAAQFGQTTTTTGGLGGYRGDPCAGLQERAAVLYAEGSKLHQRGVEIKIQYQKLETRYKLLVRQRSRTLMVEKRLQTKINASKVNIEKAIQMKTKVESSQMTRCSEVETKMNQMREFHRYRTFPLELRRQELLEWVSIGESHNCEAVSGLR